MEEINNHSNVGIASIIFGILIFQMKFILPTHGITICLSVQMTNVIK